MIGEPALLELLTLIFANSVLAFSLDRIYSSSSKLLASFFLLRAALVIVFLNLILSQGINQLFSSNFWFLLSLTSIAYLYSFIWHLYYLSTKEREVLLGVEIIDAFAGALGLIASFWYLYLLLMSF